MGLCLQASLCKLPSHHKLFSLTLRLGQHIRSCWTLVRQADVHYSSCGSHRVPLVSHDLDNLHAHPKLLFSFAGVVDERLLTLLFLTVERCTPWASISHQNLISLFQSVNLSLARRFLQNLLTVHICVQETGDRICVVPMDQNAASAASYTTFLQVCSNLWLIVTYLVFMYPLFQVVDFYVTLTSQDVLF